MATVSEHIAHALSAHASDAFGVMGNGNAYLLDAIERGGRIRYTAVRHEAGAVIAADAYHRACGRLAVATTTYGPGLTNALTPLAEAVQARVPLLLVVGDAPAGGRRPWDIDQAGLVASVGAHTMTVDLADAASVTTRAAQLALADRRPVVLGIPYDLGARDAGALAEVPSFEPPAPVVPDDAALDEVAAVLRGARRPLLLAGRGAWLAGAGEDLGRLAAAAGALTASTALARSIFPDAAHDLGVTGGFGQEEAMRLVREADVVVVFGASLTQFTMRFGSLFARDTKVVQVDLDAPTHPRVDLAVAGDARLAANGLAQRLEADPPAAPAWRDSVDLGPTRPRPEGEGVASDGRLDPRSVASRIGALLPEDRVVVSDGGHFIGWANEYWPVAAPDRMIMVGTAFQSIGFGSASAVGAVVARPESTVVLTAGDGGSLMGLADLESAIRVAGGRGMAVIWNDAAYGAEVNLYGLKGLAQKPMLIPEVDFAAIARSLGAEGVVVDELADLDRLADWTARPADERPFLLLDCRTSPHVIAPYQREVIAVNS